MCTIIVQDMIYRSWLMMITDRKMITLYPSLVFCGVQCGCACHTLTHYAWGDKLPTEAWLGCIRICVHWLFLEYGQHSPDTRQVLYVQQEIIQEELTRGSLTKISPNMKEWRATSYWDFTTCRMGPTWAIMVELQSVHLNGHWWASQLIICLSPMYLISK